MDYSFLQTLLLVLFLHESTHWRQLVDGDVVIVVLSLFLKSVFLVAHRVTVDVLEGLGRFALVALIHASAVFVFEKLIL